MSVLDEILRNYKFFSFVGRSCWVNLRSQGNDGQLFSFVGMIWNYDPVKKLLYFLLTENNDSHSRKMRIFSTSVLYQICEATPLKVAHEKLNQAEMLKKTIQKNEANHNTSKDEISEFDEYMKSVKYSVVVPATMTSNLIVSEVVLGPYSRHFKYSRDHKKYQKRQSPNACKHRKEESLMQETYVETLPRSCDLDEQELLIWFKYFVSEASLQLHSNRNDAVLAVTFETDLPKNYCDQRFRLFNLFDKGIKLDYESFFSVTPERIAEHLSERCRSDLIIVDLFCGCGGNSIQFAKSCERVIGIDVDSKKLQYARNNAAIYKVADRIEFIQADAINFLQRKNSSYFFRIEPGVVDVLFMSPPWGGPQYKNFDTFNLHDCIITSDGMPGLSLYNLLQLALDSFSHVVCFLPRNVNRIELEKLSLGFGTRIRVELEKHIVSKKVKTCTAYFGPYFVV